MTRPGASRPSDLPEPPRPMTLPALQAYVREIVRARGFTTDLNEVLILLMEELGELARELKHRRFYPERFDRENLAHEFADLLLYLVDVANGFGVALDAAWREQEQAADRRFAERARGPAPAAPAEGEATVERLAAHAEAKRRQRGFEDDDEMLLVLLTEEVGEIATEVRRRWKGLGDAARAGREIVDALHYLFRLALRNGVALEAAVREKERRNAARRWEF